MPGTAEYRKNMTKLKLETFLPLATIAAGILLAGKSKTAVSVISTLKQDFIYTMLPIARDIQYYFDIAPIITITQAAHESAYGKSLLAVEGKNLFGIKATDTWISDGNPIYKIKTQEYILSIIPKTVIAKFKKYDTWNKSALDWAKLISTTPRYNKAYIKAKAGDVPEYAKEISAAGYATDPAYAEKIVSNAKIVSTYV